MSCPRRCRGHAHAVHSWHRQYLRVASRTPDVCVCAPVPQQPQARATSCGATQRSMWVACHLCAAAASRRACVLWWFAGRDGADIMGGLHGVEGCPSGSDGVIVGCREA
eukprot:10528-Prymnesium_polylepis.2